MATKLVSNDLKFLLSLIPETAFSNTVKLIKYSHLHSKPLKFNTGNQQIQATAPPCIRNRYLTPRRDSGSDYQLISLGNCDEQ